MKMPRRSNPLYGRLTAFCLSLFALTGTALADTTITVQNINDSGPGSLRQAVLDAASLHPMETTTIDFSSNVFQKTIVLTTGFIAIQSKVTISGPAAGLLTISGNHNGRIFTILGGRDAIVNDITLADGFDSGQNGGHGGAILNEGFLHVNGCAFTGNSVTNSAAGDGHGGAIENNNGVLSLRNCTFTYNSAQGGGALYTTGSCDVRLCTFTKNFVAFNGGGGGGAIVNRGTIHVYDSTIADNTADGAGGGTYTSDVTRDRSNFSNTIIALNHAPTSADTYGAYQSGGYNLVGVSDSGNGFTLSSDHSGNAASPLDPKLKPLANNSGPVQTMALERDSPAIDQGLSSEDMDQRGFGRHVDFPGIPPASGGDSSDIGAFELFAPKPPEAATGASFDVTSEAASLSGVVYPNGSPTRVHFEYGTDANYGKSSVSQDIGDGSTGSVQVALGISGLNPNTTYHYRLVATSVDGTGNGGDLTFTTEASAPTPAPNTLLNISTRLRVLTNDNALIGGFIVTGNQSKKVIIRGLGPSLAGSGVQGALADPVLELHQGQSTIALNDNWKDTQQSDIQASTIPPANDSESAIVATLPPGAYTAILRGKNDSVGLGLIEVYDLAQSADATLANISTRGFVDTGDSAMIAGFIVGGDVNGHARVVIRGIGPSLQDFGVGNALSDPTLELHDGQGTVIQVNDNWKESQQTEITQSGLAPARDAEPAIAVTIGPGNYTAVLRGKNNATGIGVVEAYNLP
jgi:predicted outer membrane repeat protein